MKRPYIIKLVFIVVIISPLAMGIGLAADSGYQQVENPDLQISEFTVTKDTVVVGDRIEEGFSVTVTNNGSSNTTAVLMVYTANEENQTDSYRVPEFAIGPGESHTITRPLNASTPGTHGLRVAMVDPVTQQQYDVSDIKTVKVYEEPPKRVGGPIDRSEIALGALIASVLGMVGLVYHQYRN